MVLIVFLGAFWRAAKASAKCSVFVNNILELLVAVLTGAPVLLSWFGWFVEALSTTIVTFRNWLTTPHALHRYSVTLCNEVVKQGSRSVYPEL